MMLKKACCYGSSDHAGGKRRCCPDAPLRGKPPKARLQLPKIQKMRLSWGNIKALLSLWKSLPDVTDDEVEQMVQSSVENSTVSGQITDRAVAQGDTVNVNYTGYMDDEEIPDSSVEDYTHAHWIRYFL